MTERTRAPFRRLTPERRRAEILAAALELFGTREEDRVPVEEIAAAAGTSRNSVYRLFGSREQLYLAALEALADRLLEAQATPVEGSPSEQLAVRLRRHLEVISAYEAGYVALLRSTASPEVQTIRDVVRERACQRVYDGLGVESPSPRVAATVHAWAVAMEWMMLEWLRTRTLSEQDVVGLLSRSLAGMLAAAATLDGTGGDWLPRLVSAESPAGPLGGYVADMAEVFTEPLRSWE